MQILRSGVFNPLLDMTLIVLMISHDDRISTLLCKLGYHHTIVSPSSQIWVYAYAIVERTCNKEPSQPPLVLHDIAITATFQQSGPGAHKNSISL